MSSVWRRLNGRSLNEQSFSELPSSVQSESMQKDSPFSEADFQENSNDEDGKDVFDDEELVQVKALMALADDELAVGKNHARNGEWIDITMRKINILLSMDEAADFQTYLKYINIDFKFVEEKRLNLLSKYNKLVFELNKCRDDLLVFKQAKLEAVTFQLQNNELIKQIYALQEQLKEEKRVKKKWLSSSNKGASPSSEVMPLTYLEHYPRERPGLRVVEHTNPDIQDFASKSISRPVTIKNTKRVTTSVPTEVEINEQELKINELTKLT
ncbi:hypothetical protein Tco_1393547 [Tanacetum coccineum]